MYFVSDDNTEEKHSTTYCSFKVDVHYISYSPNDNHTVFPESKWVTHIKKQQELREALVMVLLVLVLVLLRVSHLPRRQSSSQSLTQSGEWHPAAHCPARSLFAPSD